MKIGVPKEISKGERRVATTPDIVNKLTKLGFNVAIETGAGVAANYTDDAYIHAGCEIVSSAKALWQQSDIVLKVQAPEAGERALLKSGQTLICFLWPAQNPAMLKELTERGVNAIAIDNIPRISRAQKMDARSSMANISGYRAIVEAAQHFDRFFTGQITAAGKVEPAKVLVIGAGVAGLAAIGAAKSMGAIVRSFDTRAEVKEQIESMNAEFLMLDFKDEDGSGEGGYAKVMSDEFIKAEMALFAAQAKDVDIIITTALIPGKPAPKLITSDMVASMKNGSVIVDLAAEQGGNCVLTIPGEVTVIDGVSIIGYTDLPSRLAAQSSQLYSNNLHNLLAEMTPKKDGVLIIDMTNDVVLGATICLEGKTTWPPPAPTLSVAPKKPAPKKAVPVTVEKNKSIVGPMIGATLSAIALLGLGGFAPANFMSHFTIFVLACFVGYMVIWSVSPALHTPLMSVTNAISSIIVIGALIQISSTDDTIKWFAVFTVLIASINIVGGFAVTHRILKMFRK
ncbi:Re/Si-specific NAD(P)(+) transhydrogenase subunit alpha [Colwellia sp. M166]|uniref:Re/Si-specific NAD(P)(+) transhydrogenase subunit alpha n=1 Tax=Colwellia sp. M166 TaxID=2583805 RepID=UPI00211EB5FD|nr:Re/Si-specific NAD(P)(+) transhydrogenase subunit alpha [Colwellia sp. M166]UUO24882.1 Re/Si-specific NAD(P)(+) transhydrogenase subunit alpha [Colwellia sp. M166]|tara:strand:- start:15817 stop:17352 length:1536 start_codon:yes stop_codon:yes gene_type:complete